MKALRLIFPIALVAFLAPNFPLGRVGFYGRFPALVLLMAACLATLHRFRVATLMPVFISMYVFLTYSFATTFWTENLLLSLAKWTLYTALTLTFLLAGTAVGQNGPQENPFEPLKWGFLPMLLASCLALAMGYGWVDDNFRGFSGNSNALGASLMLTSPWLLYELRRSEKNTWHRRFLLCLAVALVTVMMATHSRAALGSLLVLFLVAGHQVATKRKLAWIYLVVMVLVLTYAYRSGTFNRLYHEYVDKRSDAILASRGDQMTDSWEAAKEGGPFGLGFGVSAGISRYWDASRFSDSAREKGNSFLGITEETGITGLFLYCVMLLLMFRLLRSLSNTADPKQRFIAMIAIGYFVAALIHGQFEAWFLSFGPDVSIYWGTLGLAIGALTRSPAPIRTAVQTPVGLAAAVRAQS